MLRKYGQSILFLAGLSLPTSSSGLESALSVPNSNSVSNAVANDSRYIRARVIKVIDGDTIVAKINGTDEKIRYIGIDAPELKGHRNRKHKATKELEAYANEAKAINEGLLSSGVVYLLPDKLQPGRSYDRLLYHPYVEKDGKFSSIGKTLLDLGLAETANFPHQYRQQFIEFEAQAKEHCLGQWALECEKTD